MAFCKSDSCLAFEGPMGRPRCHPPYWITCVTMELMGPSRIKERFLFWPTTVSQLRVNREPTVSQPRAKDQNQGPGTKNQRPCGMIPKKRRVREAEPLVLEQAPKNLKQLFCKGLLYRLHYTLRPLTTPGLTWEKVVH